MAQSMGSFEKVLRLGEGRRLKRLAEQAAYVGTLEPEFEALSDEQLAGKTAEFKERLEKGESLEELLFEAFAAVREAFKRTIGVRLFDVQLMGGITLHEGDIAEMKTGEGKTFVAVQPLYLNALEGQGVHLVTVNDYLAKRDAEWISPVFEQARDARGVHPEPDAVRGAQGGLRRRRHVRNELGVRLRLPARQHGRLAARARAAQPPLRDRGRGRLDPDRRGAHAADHLRPAGDRGEHVLRLRAHRQDARVPPREDSRQGRGPVRGGRRLRLRREVQDRLAERGGDREGRARAQDRQPLRPAERPARQPPDAVAEGAVALQARHRLRDPGRRGQDRRREHRPDHGRPPLERGPAPGDRGERGPQDPGGARHARDDHAPELLPPLREARRDDRYGEDRGEGVRRDLRPARRRDPDERGRRAPGQERLHLPHEGRQVPGRDPRHQGAKRARASPSSSARSPSRPRSTSRSCSSARGSSTTS